MRGREREREREGDEGGGSGRRDRASEINSRVEIREGGEGDEIEGGGPGAVPEEETSGHS